MKKKIQHKTEIKCNPSSFRRFGPGDGHDGGSFKDKQGRTINIGQHEPLSVWPWAGKEYFSLPPFTK